MYAKVNTRLSLLSIIALCCLCSGASATLVHYWPFDNPSPLADEGTAYNATILTTTKLWLPHDATLADPCASYVAPSLVTGKFGQAYQTTTAQPPYSNVRLGSGTSSGSGTVDGTFPCPPITVSLWFYPLVPGGAGAGDNDFLIANYQNGSNNDRFYVNFNTLSSTNGRLIFSCGNKKDQGINTTSDPYVPVAIGSWHHAFLTVSAPYTVSGTKYVDASLVTDGLLEDPCSHVSKVQYAQCTTLDGTGNPFMFDRYGSSKRLGSLGNAVEINKSFMGIIDDVAIWNEALPVSQATFIANPYINAQGQRVLLGRKANIGSGKVGYDPIPSDKSTGGNGVTQLKWNNAKLLTDTVKCDVYLSTSKADLIDSNGTPRLLSGFKVASDLTGAKDAQMTITPTIPVADSIYWMVVTKKSTYPTDPNVYAGPAWKFDMTNAAPTANAGVDRYTYVGAGTITISGTVTDDGLPAGASVSCTWKDAGGTPLSTAVVKVGNVYTCSTTVSVGALDSVTSYTLEGNDTTGTASDAMSVYVKATPCAAAQADPTYVKNVSDVNNDCFVNFKDFALTVNTWKVCTALDATCN
jgi:hypothetical protein